MKAALSTENLSKNYGSARGISRVNMDVRPGEIFGFLGPNGAGKTTTIRILLDLIRPTGGCARVLGMDCQRESVAIRKRVGHLPGEFSVYEHLRGREMLAYFDALRGGVARSEMASIAERLGCDLDRRMGELSHGNRRKICLVQAFMHQPDLLILDEPTSGLDPLVQQEFFRMLEEVRAAGRTVFLSSHVLPEVERICDRVGIIRAGELVAVEDVARVKEKALRRVEVTFAAQVNAADFAGLSVQDLWVDGARMTCSVQGSLDPLIKFVARHEVVDLVSHPPGLEELFLAFYGEQRNEGAESHGDQHAG